MRSKTSTSHQQAWEVQTAVSGREGLVGHGNGASSGEPARIQRRDVHRLLKRLAIKREEVQEERQKFVEDIKHAESTIDQLAAATLKEGNSGGTSSPGQQWKHLKHQLEFDRAQVATQSKVAQNAERNISSTEKRLKEIVEDLLSYLPSSGADSISDGVSTTTGSQATSSHLETESSMDPELEKYFKLWHDMKAIELLIADAENDIANRQASEELRQEQGDLCTYSPSGITNDLGEELIMLKRRLSSVQQATEHSRVECTQRGLDIEVARFRQLRRKSFDHDSEAGSPIDLHEWMDHVESGSVDHNGLSRISSPASCSFGFGITETTQEAIPRYHGTPLAAIRDHRPRPSQNTVAYLKSIPNLQPSPPLPRRNPRLPVGLPRITQAPPSMAQRSSGLIASAASNGASYAEQIWPSSPARCQPMCSVFPDISSFQIPTGPFQPKSRVLTAPPYLADSATICSSVKAREDNGFVKLGEDFFKVGRVFMIKWSEPAGETGSTVSSTSITINQFGEKIFSQIRRFVVVREGEDRRSCGVLPISTYNGQGVSKKGVVKGEHGIIHTTKDPPEPLPEELRQRDDVGGMRPNAIRVRPDNPWIKLDPMSRVNYGKTYTVHHNSRVRSIGKVMEKAVPSLVYQWKHVYHGLRDLPKTNEDSNHTEDMLPSKRNVSSDQVIIAALLKSGYTLQDAQACLKQSKERT